MLLACLLPLWMQAQSKDTLRESTVTVDPQHSTGRVKALNGTNLGVPLANGEYLGYLHDYMKQLHIPFTRLHDVPLQNPGMRIVDIPLIFANADADAHKRTSYYFDQTDDYIRQCIEDSTTVYYRLGTSIEHSAKKYFVHPPRDVAKWVEIASNIIRHYTEGKWDGYHYDIRYWEIWNEPDIDGQKMWTGTIEAYNDFYAQAAKELKRRFPHLKFGGPAHSYPREPLVKTFLEHCRKHQAPLDFYSFHSYTDNADALVNLPKRVRRYLDEAGFTQTELHLNEWNYIPVSTWEAPARERMDWFYRGMRNAEAAAFAGTVLTGWQDTPLDVACQYTAMPLEGQYGVFNEYGEPTKPFYLLKAFGEMTASAQRIAATGTLPPGSRVLATKDTEGNVTVLVSCWKSGAQRLTLRIEGIRGYARIEALLLDDAHNLTPILSLGRTEGDITLSLPSSSSVVLLRCYR